jgi:hypothetical protein
MMYDTRRTKRYEAESQFIIKGYLEQAYGKGRQISETRHGAIPYGCVLGYLGAKLTTVKTPTKFRLRGGVFTAQPGDIIRTQIIPICGRMKRNVHNQTK